MTGPALQRLGILLILFGGFLELSGGVRGDYAGLPRYGVPIMVLGLLVGLVGAGIVLRHSWAERNSPD